VISDILNENNPRIQKLKEDAQINQIPCYISDSVKDEINKKVVDTTNYLGNTVRQTVKDALEDSRNRRRVPLGAPIDCNDVRALEDLFSVCHSAIRRQRILVRPLFAVEHWAINFIAEKIRKGDKLTIDDFLLELTRILLENTSLIEDVHDYLVEFERGHIKAKTIPRDAGISRNVRFAEGYGIHHPDSLHIACAHAYQSLHNEQAVFTTQDYGIIHRKQNLVSRGINLEISDPLYAIYHF
jgi:hypothetical protein